MPKSPTQTALMLSQTSWGGHEGGADGREEDWEQSEPSTAGGETSHGAAARRCLPPISPASPVTCITGVSLPESLC